MADPLYSTAACVQHCKCREQKIPEVSREQQWRTSTVGTDQGHARVQVYPEINLSSKQVARSAAGQTLDSRGSQNRKDHMRNCAGMLPGSQTAGRCGPQPHEGDTAPAIHLGRKPPWIMQQQCAPVHDFTVHQHDMPRGPWLRRYKAETAASVGARTSRYST